MIESISAFPISGIRARELLISSSVPLGDNGKELKYRLEGSLRSKKVYLVERTFDPKYIEMWHVFKEVGLPVVSSLRKSSRGTLLVPDMKADGSEVYGKNLWLTLANPALYGPRERPRPEIDNIFLELIQPDKFNSIVQITSEYVRLANNNSCLLPFDDAFELTVHPDRDWEHITLDLEKAERIDQSGRNSLTMSELIDLNIKSSYIFLFQLIDISNFLSDSRTEIR